MEPHRMSPSGTTRAAPLGVAAVLTAIVGFSFLNLIVKISHADALIFAFYRLWLGAALIVAVSLVTGRTDWRRWPRDAGMGPRVRGCIRFLTADPGRAHRLGGGGRRVGPLPEG
jgi:hypothetical protein